jgi:hypothetical protein
MMIFAWYFSAKDTTCLADFTEFLDKSVGQRMVRIMGYLPYQWRRYRLRQVFPGAFLIESLL